MSPARILIVEDHAELRKLMRLTLIAGGFRISEAEDGEEALRLVDSERPDLVLLDVMLPGTSSGLDVCREIKADQELCAIPVLLLSARTQQSDIEAGREAGADGYVTKPFSPKVLLERVEAELSKKRVGDDQKAT